MLADKPTNAQLRFDNCIWCGHPLPGGRFDRKTHDECRIKLFRWRRKLKRYQRVASDAIAKLSTMMQYEVTFNEGVEALKSLQADIQSAYDANNIARVK
jgi:hypothetical protein